MLVFTISAISQRFCVLWHWGSWSEHINELRGQSVQEVWPQFIITLLTLWLTGAGMHITPGGRAVTRQGRLGKICQTWRGQAWTQREQLGRLWIKQQRIRESLIGNNTLIMGIYLIKTKNSLGSSIRPGLQYHKTIFKLTPKYTHNDTTQMIRTTSSLRSHMKQNFKELMMVKKYIFLQSHSFKRSQCLVNWASQCRVKQGMKINEIIMNTSKNWW